MPAPHVSNALPLAEATIPSTALAIAVTGAMNRVSNVPTTPTMLAAIPQSTLTLVAAP